MSVLEVGHWDRLKILVLRYCFLDLDYCKIRDTNIAILITLINPSLQTLSLRTHLTKQRKKPYHKNKHIIAILTIIT